MGGKLDPIPVVDRATQTVLDKRLDDTAEDIVNCIIAYKVCESCNGRQLILTLFQITGKLTAADLRGDMQKAKTQDENHFREFLEAQTVSVNSLSRLEVGL